MKTRIIVSIVLLLFVDKVASEEAPKRNLNKIEIHNQELLEEEVAKQVNSIVQWSHKALEKASIGGAYLCFKIDDSTKKIDLRELPTIPLIVDSADTLIIIPKMVLDLASADIELEYLGHYIASMVRTQQVLQSGGRPAMMVISYASDDGTEQIYNASVYQLMTPERYKEFLIFHQKKYDASYWIDYSEIFDLIIKNCFE